MSKQKTKSPRRWNTGRALESFASLNEQLNELTLDEIYKCLDVETAAQRRKSIVTRLIQRAARLNEIDFVSKLKRKYAL